jgi:hypothetical protein
LKKRCDTADPDYEAEFRQAITSTIPLFINLLQAKAPDVRFQSVYVIGELANHGERQLKSVVAQLTRIPKSSFVKP